MVWYSIFHQVIKYHVSLKQLICVVRVIISELSVLFKKILNILYEKQNSENVVYLKFVAKLTFNHIYTCVLVKLTILKETLYQIFFVKVE